MCFLKWRGSNSRTKNQIEMDKKQNKLQNVAIEMVLRASDIVKKGVQYNFQLVNQGESL